MPRYINIAITQYNCETTAGANSTNKPKRKKREMKKEKCRQRRIDESEDDPQPLRPPKNSTAPQCRRIAAYQATPSGREATTTTLLLPGLNLGFLPVHGGEWEARYTRRPSRRTAAPTGVAASMSAKADRDFSRPQQTTPPYNRQLHQTRRPPTSANSLATTHAVSPWHTLRGRPDQEEATLDKGR